MLFIVDGKAVVDIPWNAALDVAAAIKEKAKDAEEIAKAEGIIFDQALLIRSGAPFGFSSHPDIQSEAAKESAHNKDLRRYLPGGVKSTEQFGRPGVVRHPPSDGSGRIGSGTPDFATGCKASPSRASWYTGQGHMKGRGSY